MFLLQSGIGVPGVGCPAVISFLLSHAGIVGTFSFWVFSLILMDISFISFLRKGVKVNSVRPCTSKKDLC